MNERVALALGEQWHRADGRGHRMAKTRTPRDSGRLCVERVGAVPGVAFYDYDVRRIYLESRACQIQYSCPSTSMDNTPKDDGTLPWSNKSLMFPGSTASLMH